MKRGFFCLAAVLLGLILFSPSAGAVRPEAPQRLAVGHVSGSPGSTFALAVDGGGGLWVWGSNHYGVLGFPYQDAWSLPEKDSGGPSYVTTWNIRTPTKLMDGVAWVDCGRDFSAAIKTDHTLWMWGSNNRGQLGTAGRNNKGHSSRDFSNQYQDEPMMVLKDVAAISCADYAVAAIKQDGTLWVWGQSDYNQLGNGGKGTALTGNSHIHAQISPVKILDDVAAVSLSELGGAAVKTDGTLWVWGDVSGGQFGDGALYGEADHPIQVGEGYRDVVFNLTCLGIKEDGSLWGWGDATRGGLIGDTGLFDKRQKDLRYQTTPVKLMDGVKKIYSAQPKADVLAAIRDDGSLWMWGDNAPPVQDIASLSPLGLPRRTDAASEPHAPTKLLDNVEHFSIQQYALALQSDGKLWCWGVNALGEVYDPATGDIADYLHSSYQLWQTPVNIPPAVVDLSGPAEPDPDDQSPPQTVELPASGVPPQDSGTAHPVAQSLEIRDEHVTLHGYALSDGAGGVTTYVRLRDLAWLLNGTAAQFGVDYDGGVSLTSGAPYASPNGTEGQVPFQGEQPYVRYGDPTLADGVPTAFQAFVLTDGQGGGHTYYKLRDLGRVLGFNVGWSAQRGMYLEPGKPYSDAD